METKLIHEHLKYLFSPQEQLTVAIAKSFSKSYVDAEEYANKLKNMALQEYRNAFRGAGNAKI